MGIVVAGGLLSHGTAHALVMNIGSMLDLKYVSDWDEKSNCWRGVLFYVCHGYTLRRI